VTVSSSRSGWTRPALAVAAVGLLLLCLASTAGADRPATRAQSHTIRRIVAARWRAEAIIPCPVGGSNKFVFRGASISTADPRFADASIDDSGCTYTLGYILRRRSPHGGRWHIVYAVLDSAQSCHDVRARIPEPVVRNFGLEGMPRGEGGTFGPC
jgi:hypothetical protein